VSVTYHETDIAVIGGGAAGFFAAIACVQANPKAHVTILERNAHVLGKVRISGGGRCNVTNACFDPSGLITNYPRGAKALLGPLTRFGPRETVAWFESHGVALKTEKDGRMFPITDDSATIVDCLLGAARATGVNVRVKADIVRVTKEASTPAFVLGRGNGDVLTCKRLILATGSSAQGWRWAQAFGHTIVPPVPSLFTFEIRDPRLEGLAGLAVECAQIRLAETGAATPAQRNSASDAVLQQTGPILVTHWGLSGPAILKLSAWGARFLYERNYQAELHVNWLPSLQLDVLLERLGEFKHERGGQRAGAHSPFQQLPTRLWASLTRSAGIHDEQCWAKLPRSRLVALATQLHDGRYYVAGKGQFKEEFVTCGGVDLDEVNFRTLESRLCPGLYFAGEILNIDGVTGGFNFQAAWTTGWLAGQSVRI